MNLRRTIPVAALIGAAVLLEGCPVSTDVGARCILVRGNPDGGQPLPIKEGEVEAGRDIVSSGATECEDLTCVRDLTFPQKSDRPDLEAEGYCSRLCAEGTKCDSSNPKLSLTCREMVLDEVTLRELCKKNPDKCQTTIGTITTSFFCAAGARDAGM